MQYGTNSIQVVKKLQIGQNYITYTPSAGNYLDNIEVNFKSFYSTDKIYYTTNGTSPVVGNSVVLSNDAILYTGSFPLTAADFQMESYEVKYLGFDKDDNLLINSDYYETITFNIDNRTNPNLILTFNPTGGTYPYNEAIIIDITANEQGTIYYTLDGSPATTASTIYTGTINTTTPATANALLVDAVGYTTTGTASFEALDIYLEGFSVGAFSLDNQSAEVSITDNGDVQEFFVSESPAPPDINDPNWSPTPPTEYVVVN
jgi:hypothetical protein